MASTISAYTNSEHASTATSSMSYFTQYTEYTTEPNYIMKRQDFLEYKISQKLNLYLFPVILLFGIPGNIISFVVLVFSSMRKSTTSLYLAVISVLDTTVLLSSSFWYINTEMSGLQIINDVSCKIINFVFYFSIHYNVILVVAVTVERFIVVVFPLKAQLWISMRRTVVVIVCCGLFSFGLNLHHVFTRALRVSRTTGNRYCGSTGGKTTIFFLYRVYPWIDSIIYCIIPMTSLFVLNTIMIRHLKKVLRRLQTLQQLNTTGNQSSQSQMTTMLLLVSVSFLVLTGPIGIFLVVRRNAWEPKTEKGKAIMNLLYSCINNMSYTNHAVNFVFYCFSGQRFRNELKRMLSCLVAKRKKPYLNSETSFIGKGA